MLPLPRDKVSWMLYALLFGLSQEAQAQFNRYRVIGVIAESANGHGVTLIKDIHTQKVSVYRHGAAIAPMTKVHSIHRRYVVLSIDGVKVRLNVGDDLPQMLDQSDSSSSNNQLVLAHKGITREGSTVRIQTALKNHLIGDNLSKVLTQAASEPVWRNGGLIGFSLWNIEKDSIFDASGFKNGDIITHINHEQINDAGKAIRILNSLRNANQAEISFIRDNQEQNVTLVIQ